MHHNIQFYKVNKHLINKQVNHFYLGGLHNPSSLLKKENLSSLRGLVNTSVIYFLVSIKFKIILFFPTSSLKKLCLISICFVLEC